MVTMSGTTPAVARVAGLMAAIFAVCSACSPSRPGDRGTPQPHQFEPCAASAGTTGDYCYPESYRQGYAILPRSTRATPGQRYWMEVSHCGLTWIADFDAAFWRVVRWDTAEPPDSLINPDTGTTRLLSANAAEYTSSRGEHITLERVEGPLIPSMRA